jgi:hypothetical protein
MPFGLAEILAEGWVLREDLVFGARETAVTVALVWSRLRNIRIGVADTEERKLVWRADSGVLGLRCLGQRRSEPPPR